MERTIVIEEEEDIFDDLDFQKLSDAQKE